MFAQLISIYDQFLSIFPPPLRGIISLVVFIMLVVWLFKLIRHNIIWIILLVIFIPASIPIIRTIFMSIVAFLDYLL